MMQVYIVLCRWLDTVHGAQTEILPRRAFLSYEEAQEAARIAEKAVTAIADKDVDFHIETIHAY